MIQTQANGQAIVERSPKPRLSDTAYCRDAGDQWVPFSHAFAMVTASRRVRERGCRQQVRRAPQRGWWFVQDVR